MITFQISIEILIGIIIFLNMGFTNLLNWRIRNETPTGQGVGGVLMILLYIITVASILILYK